MKYFVIFEVVFGVLILNFQNIYAISCDATPKTTEGRLLKQILCSFDKTERPTTDSKSSTLVNIGYVIKSFNYAEYNNKLTINSLMTMKWTVEQFKWNKNEYDGINSITVKAEDIWQPDLSLSDVPGEMSTESCKKSNCLIHRTGEVFCSPSCTHTAMCRAKIQNWPFDIHNCTLVFGSYAQNGELVKYNYLNVSVQKDGLQDYRWKIVSIRGKEVSTVYPCCPDDVFPTLHYNVILQRHSAAYHSAYIAPAIMLASINLMTLWLNPDTAERIMVAGISLYGHFSFSQQISWSAPKGGDELPNAVHFFRDSAIIATLLILHTIIMRALQRTKRAAPGWIKTTTTYLNGNKVGQMMFTNPYIINGTKLDNETEDESLVDGQQNQTIEKRIQIEKLEETKLWLTAVRIIDVVLFLILFIAYLSMIFSWIFPTNRDIPEEGYLEVIT